MNDIINGLIMIIVALGIAAKRFLLFLAGLPILLVMFISLVGGKRTEDFRARCARFMKEHLRMSGSIF